jgi:hypothetical protein
MRASAWAFWVGLAVAAAACDSHQDNVCQAIGDCSQHGDNDWISSCQAEAKALGTEAAANGCSGVFDAYYSCADSAYKCEGATATFPGCDDELAALDQCIAAATSGTACAMLSAAQTGCGTSADGGAGAGADAGVPPACTAARDCQARCYLTSVSNICAPRVDEIEAVTGCAATCPP